MKKFTLCFLVFTLCFALLSLPASADEAARSGDLFSRLGLNTITSPDNSAERVKLTPYGSKSAELLTVNELLLYSDVTNHFSPGGMEIYGDGIKEGEIFDRCKIFQPKGASYLTTRVPGHIAAVEGNFGGLQRTRSPSGRKDGLAILHGFFVDADNEWRLQLWVESLTESIPSCCIATVARIPASSFSIEQLQQNLHIAVGDIDGDGFDEIIVLGTINRKTGQSNDTQLQIWSLRNKSSETAYMNASNWEQSYTLNILDSKLANGYTASLAVGDLNRDGLDDIAYAVNKLLTKDNNTNDIFTNHSISGKVIYGTNGNLSGMKQEDIDFGSIPLSLSSFLWRPGLAIADADPYSSPAKELLIGYCTVNFFTYTFKPYGSNVQVMANLTGYGVDMWSYDFRSNKLAPLRGTDNRPLISKEFPWIMGAGYPISHNVLRQYNQIFNNASAVCVAGRKPDGLRPAVMLNSTYWQYTTDGRFEAFGRFYSETDWRNWELTPEYFLARTYYSIRNANCNGTHQYFISHSRQDNVGVPSQYYRGESSYSDKRAYFESNLANSGDLRPYVLMKENNLAPVAHRVNGANSQNFFALPDVDNDSVFLEFRKYRFLYSDPVVIAAIASPPFFKDLVVDIGNSYLSGSFTSYAKSKGQSIGETSSQSVRLGAYVACDVEIGVSVFGIGAKACIEYEASFNRGWTHETEKRKSMESAVTFTCFGGKDAVALVTIPLDVYSYNLWYPTEGKNKEIVYASKDYSVVVPYESVQTMMTLEDYNKVYEDYKDILPDIGGKVFTHTLGVPKSYPSLSSEYKGAIKSTGFMGSPSVGGTSQVSTEFKIAEEITEYSANTNAIDIKAGGGVKVEGGGNELKIRAGATFGTDETRGKVVVNTNGYTYKGALYSRPDLPRADKYNFDWQLMYYQYKGVQTFPVITYVVRNIRSPVTLPGETGVEKTTTDSITSYWRPSDDDDIAETDCETVVYDVYKVLNPSPGKSYYYHIGICGKTDYVRTKGIYSFTETGLLAGRAYTYVLSARRNDDTSINASTYSSEISAYTKINDNDRFIAQPSKLNLIPGSFNNFMTAVFTKNAASSTVKYVWEKKNMYPNSWTPLLPSAGYTGQNTNTIVFTSPIQEHEGLYRLAAILEYGGMMSGSYFYYSETAEVTFKK